MVAPASYTSYLCYFAAKEEVDAIFAKVVKDMRKFDPTFSDAATVEQAVGDVLQLISKLTIDDTGKILNRDGGNALEVWGP